MPIGAGGAAAALVGAFLYDIVAAPWLVRLFAALLVLAGGLGLSGANERLRFGRLASWIAGALSGFAGGLAGEQGGVRAVALLGFDLGPRAFVATSTATAITIDSVRTPVYFVQRWGDVADQLPLLIMMTIGVAAGAVLGRFLLPRVPRQQFKSIVSLGVLVIGLLLLIRPLG